MKKILLITLVMGFVFAQGFVFSVYELNTATSPQLVTYTNADSVRVIRYRDNGVTVIDTLYTNEWGYVIADANFQDYGNVDHERVKFEKTGYTFGDNGWLRFTVTDFDTTTDYLTVGSRMVSSPGDSTVVISFTIVSPNGTANSGQNVSHYSANTFKGTGSSFAIGTSGTSPFTRTLYTSSVAGLVEITTLKGNINYITIGDRLMTAPFVADSNMTLDNLVFDPN